MGREDVPLYTRGVLRGYTLIHPWSPERYPRTYTRGLGEGQRGAYYPGRLGEGQRGAYYPGGYGRRSLGAYYPGGYGGGSLGAYYPGRYGGYTGSSTMVGLPPPWYTMVSSMLHAGSAVNVGGLARAVTDRGAHV